MPTGSQFKLCLSVFPTWAEVSVNLTFFFFFTKSWRLSVCQVWSSEMKVAPEYSQSCSPTSFDSVFCQNLLSINYFLKPLQTVWIFFCASVGNLKKVSTHWSPIYGIFQEENSIWKNTVWLFSSCQRFLLCFNFRLFANGNNIFPKLLFLSWCLVLMVIHKLLCLLVCD